MKDMDGILVLLEDLKDLLYGIAWMIFGSVLLLGGLIFTLGTSSLLGILLAIGGLFPILAGILYARRGYHHHSVEIHEET